MSEGACLPLHMAIENALKAIEQSIADAERLLTPMPFTYVVHLRTFLFIYLMGLPFILVEDLGWLMLVAVSFLGYLMFGLENTAVQLENPFGTDCNHHPLDLYCLEVSQDLLHLLDLRASAKAQVDQPAAEQKARSAKSANTSTLMTAMKTGLKNRKPPKGRKGEDDDDGGGDDGGGD